MSESKRGGAQLARAVEKAYQAGLDDYHLEPMVLVENGRPVGKISDGDSAARYKSAASPSPRSSSRLTACAVRVTDSSAVWIRILAMTLLLSAFPWRSFFRLPRFFFRFSILHEFFHNSKGASGEL